MELLRKYNYVKKVRLNNYNLHTKELLNLIKNLTHDKNSIYTLSNDKYEFQTDDYHKFYEKTNDSSSIFKFNVTSLYNENVKLEVDYNSLHIFKNNFYVRISSKNEEELFKLEEFIIDELRKYIDSFKNVCVNIFSYVFPIITFLIMFHELIGFTNIFHGKFNSMVSLTFYLFITVLFPMFIFLVLRNMYLPTIFFKKESKMKWILNKFKIESFSIIIGIIIAAIFFVLGLIVN